VAGYLITRNGIFIDQNYATMVYDSGLTDGTSYTYTVTAYDVAGNISMPATLVVQTKDGTPPTAPTSLTATVVGGSQINLQWSGATDNVKVTSYLISRSMDGGAPVIIASVSAPTTSFSNAPLPGGSQFCYFITAQDAALMVSQPSPTQCAATPDLTPPTVPTSVVATALAPKQVSVTWTASTDKSGVAVYNVSRGTNGGTPVPIGSTTVPSYLDRSTNGRTTYNYRVSACDVAGNCSAFSAGSVVTTPSMPDATAPSVTAYAPAIATGTVTLSSTAGDPAGDGEASSGVAGVRLLVDGLDVALELAAAPYSIRYNTRALPNGIHTLTAVARDAAGNVGTSAPVTFTARN
jgi:fibronectin type 3 domain-containing protein